MTALRPLTFRGLMTESERALWRTDALPDYYRDPVCQLLDDGRRYHYWETSHARLMRDIAHAARPVGQVLALRATSLRLIHRRGLFDYLRAHEVGAAVRARLFQVFYGPVDFHEAVLKEHRHYLLAASSGYCTEVLVAAVQDSDGLRLIERYEGMYRDYFEVFGHFITAELTDESAIACALRPIMLRRRTDVERLRGDILTAPPPRPFGRRWSDRLPAVS